MEQVFLPILIGCTSAAAYLVGAKGSRLSGRALSRAVGRMLECVGLTTVFLAVNVTAGMAVILGAPPCVEARVTLSRRRPHNLGVLPCSSYHFPVVAGTLDTVATVRGKWEHRGKKF